MIILYQVGLMPLLQQLIGVNNGNVSLDDSMDWKIANDSLAGVPGNFYFGDQSRPALSPRKIKVEGAFEKDAQGLPEQKLARLAAYAGRISIPLVALNYFDANEDIEGSGQTAFVEWLLCYGVIDSVDRKFSVIQSNNWQFDTLSVSMTIEQQTPWRRLSPWLWEYRRSTPITNIFSRDVEQDGGDNRFQHPISVNTLTPNGQFYFWGDALVKYNPTFWGKKYSEGITGGLGSDFILAPQTITISPDPSSWNATPFALYAFTELNPTGSLVISVEQPTGLFSGETQTILSTLDLDTVNTELLALGLSGLLPTDIILAGQSSPYPCAILRNDSIIQNYTPTWEYSGLYPGEVVSGPNRLTFSAEGSNARIAYLFDYGVL